MYKKIIPLFLSIMCLFILVGNTQNVQATKNKKTVNVVALGDSLTYGQGDTTRKQGYVGRIKKKISSKNKVKVTTNNYGKVGDKSYQIQKRLSKSHQMQSKVKKADIITMTFGGNDLMQVLQKNFMLFVADKVGNTVNKEQVIYQKNITNLINHVRKYNKNAPIFVLSVYNPFYVYFPQVKSIQDYTNQWVDATEHTLDKFQNVYFVDVNARMSQGQFLGKNQKQLVKNTTLDLSKSSSKKIEDIMSDNKEKNDYLSSSDHFHPNNKGYNYISNEFYQSLEQEKSKWLKKGN